MPRVVIIGGGAAGLQCARSLQCEHGLPASDVLIVEAMPQLGGRMRQSVDFVPGGQHPVEVGAEFVHGAITRLNGHAADFGWDMDELFTWAHGDGGPSEEPAPDGGVGAYYMGKERKLLAYDSDDADFVHLNETLQGLWEIPEEVSRGDKRTLGQYLRDQKVSERMMGFAEAGYANTCGGTLDDLSFEYICCNERNWTKFDGEGDFRMRGTFADLIAALADPALFSSRRALALAAAAAHNGHGQHGYASASREARTRVPAAVEQPLNVRLGTAVTTVEWSGMASGGGGSDGKLRLTLKPAAFAVAEAAAAEATAKGPRSEGCAAAAGSLSCCGHRASGGAAAAAAAAGAPPHAATNVNGCGACPVCNPGGHTSWTETMDAEVVVVTVPLPLLRSQTLPVFSPPLPPAKLAAAGRVGCGVAAKLLLLFDGPLPPWPQNLHGVVCADCCVPEFWFRTVFTAGHGPLHLATGFLQARFRDDAVARGEAATVALACDLLDDMFGRTGGADAGAAAEATRSSSSSSSSRSSPAAAATCSGGGAPSPGTCRAKLVKAALHDWGAEPFARLGYTHCPHRGGAGEADFRALASPLAVGVAAGVPAARRGALLFAGEGYISTGANMTVHAALDAGARAAGEAAAVLKARAHAATHVATHTPGGSGGRGGMSGLLSRL